MRLNAFESRFQTEDDCVEAFKAVREKHLPDCPICGTHQYKWIPKKQNFECLKCRKRISLTAGTVMEKSKIPLRDWLYTIHLMTSVKQVLSAKEVQYQLSYKTYEPVWLMMMKLRDIMGKRDNEYTLGRWVEVDEAFFPTIINEKMNGRPLKKGLGSEQKSKVLVIAKSIPVVNLITSITSTPSADIRKAVDLYDRSKRYSAKSVVHYVKMFVLKDLSAETIDQLMKESVAQDAVVVSDGFKSHKNFKERFEHLIMTEGDEPEYVVKNHLPWVHIVTGECRNAITAIHRQIDKRFLQLYLNEYCWKFNRRIFRKAEVLEQDLFYRLLNISAKYTSTIKWRDFPIDDEDSEDVLSTEK